MRNFLRTPQSAFPRRVICSLVATAFVFSQVLPTLAQIFPAPGQMILLSPGFQPPVLKGMAIHPENPLLFDFIVDRGQEMVANKQLRVEGEKLIKYFLAAMTIPDQDSWVNLSPYEKDRIMPDALSQTEMGRQMLEQDYILKQLSASLTNPDKELGQQFWAEVKARAQKQLGTADVPLSTFNKVWIIPDSATVVEKDGFVYITESKLKVLLDQDYIAEQYNRSPEQAKAFDSAQAKRVEGEDSKVSELSSQVFREMILPKLIKEVNTGKNFAQTRQVYQSVILSAWYKKALRDSLLGKIYADKSKIQGIESGDKNVKDDIYAKYVEAFKKGAYNIIKEENNGDEVIPRKYFSGGMKFNVDLKIDRSSSAVNGVVSLLAEAKDQIVLIAASAAESKEEVNLQSASSAVNSTKVFEHGIQIIDAATDIGSRDEQQDNYYIGTIPGIGSIKAVMDGHGQSGVLITEKVKDELENAIISSWEEAGDKYVGFKKRYKETLRLAFRKLDQAIKADKTILPNRGGTTLSVVIIPEDNSAAYVGILGDSPVLIVDKMGHPNLSPLHNAGYNFEERMAAQKRGARYFPSFHGGIGYIGLNEAQVQITRGLGDTNLKVYSRSKAGKIIEREMLNRKPDIYSVELGPDSKVLLASDGLADFGNDKWGVIVNVLTGIKEGKSAQDLVDESLQANAIKGRLGDNVTALIWKSPGLFPSAQSASSSVDHPFLRKLKITPEQQRWGKDLSAELFRLGISGDVFNQVVNSYIEKIEQNHILSEDGSVENPTQVLSQIVQDLENISDQIKLELKDVFEIYLVSEHETAVGVLYVAAKDLNVTPLLQAGPLVSYIFSLVSISEDMPVDEFFHIVLSAEVLFRKALEQDPEHIHSPQILIDVISALPISSLHKQIIKSTLFEAFEKYKNKGHSSNRRSGFWGHFKKWLNTDNAAEVELARIVAHPAFFQKFHEYLMIDQDQSGDGFVLDISPDFRKALVDFGTALESKMEGKGISIKSPEKLAIIRQAYYELQGYLGLRSGPPLSYKTRRDIFERYLYDQRSSRDAQFIHAAFIEATNVFEKSELGRLDDKEFQVKTGQLKGSIFDRIFTAIDIAQADHGASASSAIFELRKIHLIFGAHGEPNKMWDAFEHFALMTETNDPVEKEKHRIQFIKDLDAFLDREKAIIVSSQKDVEYLRDVLNRNSDIRTIGIEFPPEDTMEAEKVLLAGKYSREKFETQLGALGVANVKEKVDQLILYWLGPAFYLRERHDPAMAGVKIVGLDNQYLRLKSQEAREKIIEGVLSLTEGLRGDIHEKVSSVLSEFFRRMELPSDDQVRQLTDILRENKLEGKIPDLQKLLEIYMEGVRFLVIERDKAMAENIKILTNSGTGIVAIFGNGHKDGVVANLLKIGISILESQLHESASSTIIEVSGAGIANEVTKGNVGGIDFDPSKLNLQIKRDGHGVALPLPQQDLQNIDIKGLYPVIINILPVSAATLPILSQFKAEPPAVVLSKT